jgi:SAM-dependent methyltransferase
MKAEYSWLAEYDKPDCWSNFSPVYFQSFPFPFGLYFNLNDNKLRKFLKNQKGKIVDLGCGNGRFLAYADLGVDFSKAMVKRAKRTGKQVILASLLHLPFRDKSFDTAFMVDTSGVINPTKRKEAYSEAKRVAETFYDFLAHDRTFIPFLLSVFQRIALPIRLTAHLVLLLSFPIDRIRKLAISHGHFASS